MTEPVYFTDSNPIYRMSTPADQAYQIYVTAMQKWSDDTSNMSQSFSEFLTLDSNAHLYKTFQNYLKELTQRGENPVWSDQMTTLDTVAWFNRAYIGSKQQAFMI